MVTDNQVRILMKLVNQEELLKTVAAKAAHKIGQIELANTILANAEQKALEIYNQSKTNRTGLAEQIAWFYCFGNVQPDQAIDWANKAYASEPNSPTSCVRPM